MEKNILTIASEIGVGPRSVQATVELLDGGATVPFIARYRKEVTGSLDEVAITTIRDRITQLRELDKRKETVINTISDQGKLTDELRAQIDAAATMAELEDIYLPYKPKRRTRATIAREKGLEPLAFVIFAQNDVPLNSEAAKYINEELQVPSLEEAIAGARDIIAEWVNEDKESRRRMRNLFENEGIVVSKVITGKEEEGAKYKDYFDWSEPIKTVAPHRLLAMRRGERESILTLDFYPEEDSALTVLETLFVNGSNEAAEQVKIAVKDSYKRLLKPSMETEIRLNTKQSADEASIRVFTDNLRQLLMAAPLGQRRVLALDPGFRTGCKLVCLDAQGKLLHHDAIYPHEPQKQVAKAGETVKELCKTYQIEAISIGNGTASRETEAFVRSLKLPASIQIVMVNESGASIYSASETAREEFPNYDVTVRGAVSIGRRLMDPLAELVKLDPKSIGVGQYQHDVDQVALKQSLDDTVLSCVNKVGVEVNTASKELLTYVSGLNNGIAKNIVKYREEHGKFVKREDLKKVSRLGDKAFEQAAGFLRISDGENPLDASSVHPESYYIVERMAADLQCSVKDLILQKESRASLNIKKYVTDTIGLPTLEDIMAELEKPGRDPREQFEAFQFAEGVEKISDLKVGMKLPGIVTNITNFGVFVDVGVHQDGLVHLSQLADKYVKHPSEVVKVHQKVEVRVMEVDPQRKRISFTMKTDEPIVAAPPKQPKIEAKPSKIDNKKQGDQAGKKPVKPNSKPTNQKPKESEPSMDDMLKMLKDKFR